MVLTLRDKGVRLCDGWSRREVMRVGGLGLMGLSLADLHAAPAPRAKRKARSCILLFLMGGPPQHSTWDPKPAAPAEVRGAYRPIATSVPGTQIGELLPLSAQRMHEVCLLRAVSTADNAHSSSGYAMLTGVPHVPTNVENANPGAPNDWPSLAAMVQHLNRGPRPLPAAVRLPHHIFNTDGSVWPGQDAGWLGRAANPWLFHCEPASPQILGRELTLAADLPSGRIDARRSLLAQVDAGLRRVDHASFLPHERQLSQAYDLLRSPRARNAFDLDRETATVRDRFGRAQFGQSVLLARRLVEAGVSLVQVNWYRAPDEPADNPCWDSHTKETERLKTALCPPFDQAFSALLDDLTQRGMLEETLVLCLSEFGRTPRFNSRGGRDHWGPCFSVALAGGGIRGGLVHGASDAHAAYPKDGTVLPGDLTATVFHCLGYEPETEIRDTLGRPHPLSRGRVIRQIV
jgi:uncharacterized protein (DUF1501 family)